MFYRSPGLLRILLPGFDNHVNLVEYFTFAQTGTMDFNLKYYLTVNFTLFAVNDIIGTIPILISLKSKLGGIREATVTLISGALMVFFFIYRRTVLESARFGR